jgi:hypothetical protein
MVWLILAAHHPSPYSATPVVTDTFFPHASIPHLVLRKLMMLENPMPQGFCSIAIRTPQCAPPLCKVLVYLSTCLLVYLSGFEKTGRQVGIMLATYYV